MVIKSAMDIIGTIEDHEEVEALSEDSDVEMEVMSLPYLYNGKIKIEIFLVPTIKAKITKESLL